MSRPDNIVAVCLLTESDMLVLGDRLKRVFRLDDQPCFADLLAAIDRAERQSARSGNPAGA